MTVLKPEAIIRYWLDAGHERWFTKDPAFDADIRQQFGAAVDAAQAGELDGWLETLDGRLALVILLDQFPRNMHRGSARAFSYDEKALAVARHAIAAGDFEAQPAARAQWLLLPFEHHEGMAEQEFALALAGRLGDAELIKFAKIHRDIIRQFGRFPHRNTVLGRESTEAERDFLAEGGFAG